MAVHDGIYLLLMSLAQNQPLLAQSLTTLLSNVFGPNFSQ